MEVLLEEDVLQVYGGTSIMNGARFPKKSHVTVELQIILEAQQQQLELQNQQLSLRKPQIYLFVPTFIQCLILKLDYT